MSHIFSREARCCGESYQAAKSNQYRPEKYSTARMISTAMNCASTRMRIKRFDQLRETSPPTHSVYSPSSSTTNTTATAMPTRKLPLMRVASREGVPFFLRIHSLCDTLYLIGSSAVTDEAA